MRWANFFHIYQPPRWPTKVIRRVSREAYRPLVRFLKKNRDVKITLNISGSLTTQLSRLADQRDILTGLRTLMSRGQVEPVDSAMYHAILPLIPAAEVVRQIRMNHAANRRVFGSAYRPSGFFPPEMAYSPAVGRILKTLGYRWVILDGIHHPGLVDYTVQSRIAGNDLVGVFRNRFMSDYLAFEAHRRDRPKFFSTAERWSGQSSVLITAMDGENLGHHRHEARPLWQSLVRIPRITTLTISELIAFQAPVATVRARTGSWSTSQADLKRRTPLALWHNPRNQLHRLQWRLFSVLLRHIERRERRRPLSPAIRRQLDEAMASDWYWWASCEPYWDFDIIANAANRLQVLAHEIELDRKTSDTVQGLVRDIISTAHQWQASGTAQRHAAGFLAGSQTPRYLGGNRIHYPQPRKR